MGKALKVKNLSEKSVKILDEKLRQKTSRIGVQGQSYESLVQGKINLVQQV